MADFSDYGDIFADICREWDEAEKDLKRAEQVAEQVVFPAIKELRYAGRRLAQAMKLASADGDKAEIQKLLQDAAFNCHRARHDAIDAASAQIAKILDLACEKLGHDVVLAVNPQFSELIQKVEGLRDKIVKARGSPEDRDRIYEIVENADFPNLIEAFQKFRSSESLMTKMAAEQRWRRVRNDIFGYIGILGFALTVIGLIFDFRKH